MPHVPSITSASGSGRRYEKLRLRIRVGMVAAAMLVALALVLAGVFAPHVRNALLRLTGSSLAFWLLALVLAALATTAAWVLTGRMVRPLALLAQQAAAAEAALPPATAPAPLETEVKAVQRVLSRLARSAQENQLQSALSERQFATLAESLPHVIWLADSRGRLQYVNRPWLADAPLAVADFARYADASERPRFAEAWRQSLELVEPLRLRCRLRPPGAERPHWTDVQATPIAGEGDASDPVRWVGSLVDVDESVMLAQMQERALDEERNARADAENAARMRDDFLGAVSHELRSPLSAISGWAEILARTGQKDPMVAKAGEVIRRNAQMQTSLIDDLLDMTTMAAGRMELVHEVIDLSRVVRESVTSHLAAAQGKGLALDWRHCEPVIVEGDERRLAQVVTNAITNAIKFTPAGGQVTLSTGAEGQWAVLRVADSGRGISAAFLPHVFDRLRQEEGMAAARTGGLGLGLAIARGIVELHGGAIAIDSPGPGKGTTLTVRLPLGDAASEEDAYRSSMAALDPGFDLLGSSVLVVDDEADAREVAQVALTTMGANVQLAANGQEALEAVQRQRFDFLVSDIGMPGMDGLELIRKVRGLAPPHNEVPAVALTAFALAGDVAAGLEAGFHAYAAKPISLRGLATAIVTAQKRVARRGSP